MHKDDLIPVWPIKSTAKYTGGGLRVSPRGPRRRKLTQWETRVELFLSFALSIEFRFLVTMVHAGESAQLFANGMRPMKPFGVRLAAGAVTILLGAIMAAQAQKDHQNQLQSSWDPLENTSGLQGDAPAPIQLRQLADGQWSDSAITTPPKGEPHRLEPNPFEEVPGAVQLVQHTEDAVADVADAATQALKLPGFLPPGEAKDSDTPAASAPAISLPGAPPQHAPSHNAAALEIPEGNSFADTTADAVDDIATRLNLPPTQPVAMPDHLAGDAGAVQGEPQNDLRGAAQLPHDAGANQFAADQFAANQHVANQHAADQHAQRRAADEGAAQQRHDEMVRQQQAREDELARQRHDEMRQREQLAQQRAQQERERQEIERQEIERQRQAQQFNTAATMNQFAADNRYNEPNMPASNMPASNFGNHDSHFDNANGGQRLGVPASNHFDRHSLQTLPASHSLSNQSNSTFAQPGDRRLEGAQAPSVVIHKRAPSEVKVGKPASFVIDVQNVGSTEALDVRVHDQVPAGMKFQDASPKPQGGPNGSLVWQLGALAAGEERTITMKLIPVEEGELGSVARVTFQAAASVRTMSTRPELKIVQKAPKTVLVGQQLEIEVEVSNPGTGDATGVMLQEDVPENLEHPRGRELDNLVGTLRPGEVRRQMLRLRAVAPGMVRNTIFLRGDDGMETSHSVDVQVVAPELQVALSGPSRRFVERQAVYNLDIGNSGTAPANNIRIAAFLDRGFTFVSTGNAGQYDPSRHAVFWSLDDLPVGARGQVPLTLLPVQEGSRTIQLEATADLGVTAKNEHHVTVESLAELTFSVADSADPIEIGTETTYEIKVSNHGTKADSNVSVQVQLPPGMELLDAEDARMDPNSGIVIFRPRPQLAANSELVYRLKARGVHDGRHKIIARVESDQSSVPVTKEESTMVYDDRHPGIAQGQRNVGRPVGQSFR